MKPGGVFAAMKGNDPEEEIKEAAYSMKELKGSLVESHNFNLPVENSERHIVLIKKTAPTPKKYPRKAGTPLKTPLI
ncbi:Ribosomal RNA small subunit methyltransferase G [compost metagenome]